MSLKIKVCGLTNLYNIQKVCALEPDYIGFILYPKSKRYVKDLASLELASIAKNIIKTAVFVNSEISQVVELVSQFKFDAVQFSGDENSDYIEQVKNKLPNTQILKAFGISSEFDFDVEDYADFCDYFIFDTKTSGYGGSGVTFDWNILNSYKSNKKFFLSGGLKPDLLDSIMEVVNNIPSCVGLDLNSGFEVSPGIKDSDKLASFMEKIR